MVELADKTCDPDTDEGAWLKGTRLKAKAGLLTLVPDWEKETCGEDCETVARACRETCVGYACPDCGCPLTALPHVQLLTYCVAPPADSHLLRARLL
jgi:hypothetical protein